MSLNASPASVPSVSLCLIVKNEAQNLARCLSSAAERVDEVIVIDTGSDDETIAIAQQYGAQVGHFQWCDDFAAARNHAITQATSQWVLMLDADEELIVESLDWRHQLPTAQVLALTLDLRDADDQAGLTVLRTPRLFRNHPDLRYAGRYHEHLTDQHQPLPQAAVAHLDTLAIVHYGYTAETLPHKSLQRIPILETIRQQEGLDLMLLWTLSGMYECTQNIEKVQECYDEAFERLLPVLLSGEKPDDFRSVPSWMYSLGVRFMESEDVDTLRLLCQRGQEWCSTYPPINYLTGLLIKGLGFPLGAVPYFESCTQAGQTNIYDKGEPFDPSLMTTRPALELGMIHLDLKNYQQAQAAFELALIFDPNYVSARQYLEKLQQSYRKSRLPDESLEVRPQTD
jgi:glycosyltransferase involved in cell wall biosynthesis